MNCWNAVASYSNQQRELIQIWRSADNNEKVNIILEILWNMDCAVVVHSGGCVIWRNSAACQLSGSEILVGFPWEPDLCPRAKAVWNFYSVSDVFARYMLLIHGQEIEIQSAPIDWLGEPVRIALGWPEEEMVPRRWEAEGSLFIIGEAEPV